MVNPANQTNTTIPEETYNILNEIKLQKNCTFDELLNRLCELDQKYNYISHIQNYELYYQDNIFPFTITFKKNDMKIEYKTPTGKMSDKISEWGVPDKIRKQFYTFVNESFARCMLENIPLGLVFKEFDIYNKVG